MLLAVCAAEILLGGVNPPQHDSLMPACDVLRRISIAENVLERRDDFPDRAIPEERGRGIFPLRVGRKEDGIVPEKSLLLATGGLRLSGHGFSDAAKFQRDKMLRIPELPRA